MQESIPKQLENIAFPFALLFVYMYVKLFDRCVKKKEKKNISGLNNNHLHLYLTELPPVY